jgi:hypothetical protein
MLKNKEAPNFALEGVVDAKLGVTPTREEGGAVEVG